VREQGHYLLGVVADERLSAALFGMFMAPGAALDADFVQRCGRQGVGLGPGARGWA
jgi:hypothetical protein